MSQHPINEDKEPVTEMNALIKMAPEQYSVVFTG